MSETASVPDASAPTSEVTHVAHRRTPDRTRTHPAAADPATNTALQGASIGTGASALNANNAYALNRNSDVAYDDRSKGVDAQLYLNFTENLSTVITYTHLVQAVTGGFEKAARDPEIDLIVVDQQNPAGGGRGTRRLRRRFASLRLIGMRKWDQRIMQPAPPQRL